MTQPNRHVVSFVFVTILLDAMSFGLIMPVLPRLLMRVGSMPLAEAIDVSAWMSLLMALAAFSPHQSSATCRTRSGGAKCC